MTEGIVELEPTHAEELLEAAGALRDDIASGRVYGKDREETTENAEDLNAAYRALRDELMSVDADAKGEYTRCDVCDRVVIRSEAMTPLPARDGDERKQADAYLCDGCKTGLRVVL